MICNFGILYHHWTQPPHPKFVMRWPRYISIRLHLLSGTTEILAVRRNPSLPIMLWVPQTRHCRLVLCRCSHRDGSSGFARTRSSPVKRSVQRKHYRRSCISAQPFVSSIISLAARCALSALGLSLLWMHADQTPIVFGTHLFMIPCYVFVCVVKLYMAARLLSGPCCMYDSVVLFNVHAIYAWCRVFVGVRTLPTAL